MYTVKEIFDEAVRLHQSGNLAQADQYYRQVIQADPNHAEAAHLLGLLAAQTGHPEAAEALIRRAIALKPNAGAFNFNLGLILKNMGKLAEAADCFWREIRINFNNADAHNNLGMILVGQGRVVDGINGYLQALRINPNHADAHNNLGIARALQKQYDEAIKSLRTALSLDPNNPNSHINLGNVFKEQGQFAEASECYRAALRLKPDHANAHNHLGLSLLGQGQLVEALDAFKEALKINPKYANAHNNLGNAYQDLGLPEEAIASYRQALQFSPENANVHNNLGSALVAAGRLADAVESYQQAIERNPKHADAHNNLGIALVGQGRLSEGIASFQNALALNPDHRMGLWNQACLRLLQGDFEGGWAGYEHRWAQPEMVPRPFTQPRWDGGSLEDKTILVYAEQGLGDTIQFARYLPLVKERGGNVVFECQPALVKLMAGSAGADQQVAFGADLPPFDVQIPLLSLPGLFRTTLANIPAKVPYLKPDPKLVERWTKEIRQAARPKEGKPAKSLRIGIVWQGSMNQKGDRRSLPLKHFAPIAAMDDIQLVSLQVGPAISQIADTGLALTDLGSSFDPNCLADLAAAIASVNLVITVDTAAAHLAGTLGVPVWVTLALSADWRWLLERADSPWYPTMRLFRQSTFGDWDDVFAHITEKLSELRARAVSSKRG
jgi:tetratricopeptide (TPR) repeat protein